MLINLAFVNNREQTKTLYICLSLWLTIIVNLVRQRFATSYLLIYRQLVGN
jgi:hypothetical protein